MNLFVTDQLTLTPQTYAYLCTLVKSRDVEEISLNKAYLGINLQAH